MKLLFVGDIVGRPGRDSFRRWVPELRSAYSVDMVVANGENAAGGLGATPGVLKELLDAGADALTLGNHTWRKKELAPALDGLECVARPANYPDGNPGLGSVLVSPRDGLTVGVVNLVGRVFMDPQRCPFEVGRAEVDRLREITPLVFVDFHAEATSEKIALGWHLDGRCTAVIGTHTHVQTADERVLPGGTAYITDAGMTGPFDSVIGVRCERAISKFVTGMPSAFEVAKGRPGLCGVVIDADEETGRARAIERIARLAD